MEERIIDLVRQTWYGDNPENQGTPAQPQPDSFVGHHVNAYRVRRCGNGYELNLAESMAHHIPLAIIQAANVVMEEQEYRLRYERISNRISLTEEEWERVFELISG